MVTPVVVWCDVFKDYRYLAFEAYEEHDAKESYICFY